MNYDLLFLLEPDIQQDRLDEIVNRTKNIIESNGGKIINAQIWGKRRMAYPIRKKNEGIYVYIIFSGLTTLPKLIDNYFKTLLEVMRSMVTKVHPKKLEKINQGKFPEQPTGDDRHERTRGYARESFDSLEDEEENKKVAEPSQEEFAPDVQADGQDS